MRGRLLRLKSGVTVVPHTQCRHGWTCVIVDSKLANYPVGGYDIHVFADDLAIADEVTIGPKKEKKS
mgnify:CR=1 FL=1